ncbi:MAG: hypothetical protein ACETVY_00470 [Candidatus Bathyarchaeia archaeon]
MPPCRAIQNKVTAMTPATIKTHPAITLRLTSSCPLRRRARA